MLIRFNGLPMPLFDQVDAGGGAGAEESEVAEPTEAEEAGGAEEEIVNLSSCKSLQLVYSNYDRRSVLRHVLACCE